MSVSARGRAASAALAVLMLTAACGGSDDDSGGGSDDEITLTVGLFGTFDFDNAGLYDEYMELHPNVTIEQNAVASRLSTDKPASSEALTA